MKKSLFFLLALMITGGCYAQTFKIENNQLVLDKPLLFKAGTSEILKESEEVLAEVKKFLDEKTYITLLRIEGHVAGGENTQNLSEQRAVAVMNWLVKQGVDCKRLIAVGFGDTKPVVAVNSPDEATNSRIVFAMAALRGRAIGGMPVDGNGKMAVPLCE